MAYTYPMTLDETSHDTNDDDQESLTPNQIADDFISLHHSSLKAENSLNENEATSIASLIKNQEIDLHHRFSTQKITGASLFSVGEDVLLYESIPGFLSSKATVSSMKVDAGTYVIDQVTPEARHPIKLLKNGVTNEIWVDADKLYKPACGFFPSDSVYVTHPTAAYETAMSSEMSFTLPCGYYNVSKIANGSKHPVYLLSDDLTAGVWVGTDDLILKVKPPLFQAGEEVTLIKKTPSYKTSSSLKQGKLLEAGTYYIYQYQEDESHPLNLTKILGQEGLWVNSSDLKRK